MAGEEREPAKHLIAKRLDLRQGDKMKFIENCTVGGFNST